MAVQAKPAEQFNKKWPVFVRAASYLVPRADPDSLLVRLNLVFPEEENESIVELPSAGETHTLHFPKFAWMDLVGHSDEMET